MLSKLVHIILLVCYLNTLQFRPTLDFGQDSIDLVGAKLSPLFHEIMQGDVARRCEYDEEDAEERDVWPPERLSS